MSEANVSSLPDTLRRSVHQKIDDFFPDQSGNLAPWLEQLEHNAIDKISGSGRPVSESDLTALFRYMSHTLTNFKLNNLEMCITMDCNVHCRYCFVNERYSGCVLDDEGITRSVDLFLERAGDEGEKGEHSITLLGGEPLLFPEKIRCLVDYAEERGKEAEKRVTFNATTNGTLINEQTLDRLRDKVKLLVSIDGDEDTTDRHRGKGTYEKVVRGIPLLKSRQGWIGSRITVHPDCVDRLYESFRHVAGLGFNQFIIGKVRGDKHASWDEQHLQEYNRQYLRIAEWYLDHKKEKQLRINDIDDGLQLEELWGCRACTSMVSINPYGEIYPCVKFYGFQEFCLGNVYSANNPALSLAQLPFLVNSDAHRPSCKACDLGRYCAGGCPAENYEDMGNTVLPSPHHCHVKRSEVALREAIQEMLNGREEG